MEDNEYIMYILVNADLGMSPGKTAAQVGHVVEALTDRINTSLYEDVTTSNLQFAFRKYRKTGHKKVVLAATQAQLNIFKKLHDAEHVIDEGRTEIAPGSLTVVGFLPSNNIKHRFEGFKTL